MEGQKQNVIIFALLTRVVVIISQMLSNALIPDHVPGVFDPPKNSSASTLLTDQCISIILGGFKRWDGLYFLHIAEFGYTYENCLAFFPLYPYVVRIVANVLYMPLGNCLSYTSLILISAIFVSLYCFVRAADTLYELSLSVLRDRKLAYRTSLLFCITPANVFFSAPYSESMFAYITFKAMYNLNRLQVVRSSFLFGVTALVRSNGLVSTGFIVYHIFHTFIKDISVPKKDKSVYLLFIKCLKTKIFTVFCMTLACISFIYWQFFAYRLFCQHLEKSTIPTHLIQYGRKMGYKIVGDSPSVWCLWKFPLSYSYIQTHHWDVGFLRYYHMKQIPNFLLSSPMIILCVSAIVIYYRTNQHFFLMLGLLPYDKDGAVQGFRSPQVYPYIIHLVFLTTFSTLFIHIQVTTRLIASASPIIYWFCAHIMSTQDTATPVQSDGNLDGVTADSSASEQTVGRMSDSCAWENNESTPSGSGGNVCKTGMHYGSCNITDLSHPIDVSQSPDLSQPIDLSHSTDFSQHIDVCQPTVVSQPTDLSQPIDANGTPEPNHPTHQRNESSEAIRKTYLSNSVDVINNKCIRVKALSTSSFSTMFQDNSVVIDLGHFNHLHLFTKLIYIYFILYSLIGTIAFSNFFPWT